MERETDHDEDSGQATIVDLQDALQEVIECGGDLDYGKIRHIHKMLDTLTTIASRRNQDPSRVMIEREIVSMLQGEIAEIGRLATRVIESTND